jgi:hypothetical protein
MFRLHTLSDTTMQKRKCIRPQMYCYSGPTAVHGWHKATAATAHGNHGRARPREAVPNVSPSGCKTSDDDGGHPNLSLQIHWRQKGVQGWEDETGF